MKKRFLSLCLCIALLLAGCGNTKTENGEQKGQSEEATDEVSTDFFQSVPNNSGAVPQYTPDDSESGTKGDVADLGYDERYELAKISNKKKKI